jgi:hypothetical protein
MSAYIVEATTINRIVTLVGDEFRKNPFLRDTAKQFTVDVVREGWKQRLAQAMYDINVEAVNQRYNEENTRKDFVYTPVPYGSRITAFKSLQCWMYQCKEGTVPQTSLYRYFEELKKQIAINIVMDLPEYDKAQWG